MTAGHSYAGLAILAAMLCLGGTREAAAKYTAATNSGYWGTASVWSNGVPETGDVVVISSTASVILTNSTPPLEVFTNNGTLTFRNWDTALNATHVIVNGTVTHSNQTALATNTLGQWVPDSRVWIVCSNLAVLSGKSISADGKGYIFAGPGNSGGGSRAGAGHGGAGGTGYTAGGPIYGNTNYPVDPGSTGGSQGNPTNGGAGGGAVRIQASGAVSVQGTIRADGLQKSGDNGGGSGGSVYIDCLGISGPGEIRARGGNAGTTVNAGGGGGGRVAVYYASFDQHFGVLNVDGGYQSITATNTASCGKTGTLVWKYTGTNPVLAVEGTPLRAGTPSPYPYGSNAVPAAEAVVNSVASPTDEAAGQRYVFMNWTLSTNGVQIASGDTPAASFTMPETNALLVYTWTNQFYLSVNAGSGGAADTSKSGWYTNGAQVAITQSPDSGYYFSQWIGDVPESDRQAGTLIVTMDRPRSVKPVFGTETPLVKSWGGTGNWTNSGSWNPAGMPGYLDTVHIRSGNVTVAEAVWMDNLLVSNNATVTFTNWTATLNADAVEIRGTLTHEGCVASMWTPEISNRVSLACASLLITTSGVVSADGKGYSPQGPGNIGLGSRFGGSYGGSGGYSTMKYGTPNAAADPGSTGGGQSYPYGGGRGGGAVRLVISGSFTNEGVITANGLAGGQDAGGGSGGGIYIACQTVGGNGVIRAIGGAGNNSSAGGGGGGRISLNYNPALQSLVAPQANLRLSTAPGSITLASAGALGSLWLTDTNLLPLVMTPEFNGVIWNVTNWSPSSLVCSGMVQFAESAMQFSSSGSVLFDLPATNVYKPNLTFQRFSCQGPLWLGMRRIDLTNQSELVAGGLVMTNGASLYVASVPTNGGLPGYSSKIEVTGPAFLAPGCWIYPDSHPTNGGSAYFKFYSLTISTNAGFNANISGFSGLYNVAGYGPGAGLYNGTGGGYGGLGGRQPNGTGGLTNGIAEKPGHPGSAGSSQNNATTGRGGGYVRIEVDKAFRLSGTLAANGGLAPPYCGAGSGGGIYIRCGTFVGSPTANLIANGGTGQFTNYWSCGGGGGRIAVWRSVDLNGEGVVNTAATGGVGVVSINVPGYAGTNGTVFWGWLPTSGTLMMVK